MERRPYETERHVEAHPSVRRLAAAGSGPRWKHRSRSLPRGGSRAEHPARGPRVPRGPRCPRWPPQRRQREITSRRSPHGENRGGLVLPDAGAASARARRRSHTRLQSRSRRRSPFDSLGGCRRIGPRSSPSLVGSGASIISSKVVSSSAKAAMTIASTGVSLLVLPEVRTKSSRCDSIAPKTRSLRSARVPRARPASMQLP